MEVPSSCLLRPALPADLRTFSVPEVRPIVLLQRRSGVDGYETQQFPSGMFCARVPCGSRITMEQAHINERLRTPRRLAVQAAAKILFIKSLVS